MSIGGMTDGYIGFVRPAVCPHLCTAAIIRHDTTRQDTTNPSINRSNNREEQHNDRTHWDHDTIVIVLSIVIATIPVLVAATVPFVRCVHPSHCHWFHHSRYHDTYCKDYDDCGRVVVFILLDETLLVSSSIMGKV